MTSTPTTSTNGAKPTKVGALIWSIAELLRGDIRPADYGSFILPFAVLRRIDCVLEAKKSAIVAVAGQKTFEQIFQIRESLARITEALTRYVYDFHNQGKQ